MAKPGADIREPEQRRARVLAWTLATLILLVSAALIEVWLVTYPDDPSKGAFYLGLIASLLGILIVAFIINYRGQYYLSAVLTVVCSFLGPWLSVLLDRSVLRGDVVPLVYITLSLFLSALLLPVWVTGALAMTQFLAVLEISYLVPGSVPINWPSLLAFIFFTSVLATVSTVISRADLNQIAMQNMLLAENQAKTLELSIRDPLTGLYNRRFLEERLAYEVDRARSKNTTVGLVIVDVDNFKHVNDLYGHPEGDSLLRLIGITLRTHIRMSDFVCRYGGDEFVLILPGASLAITRQRAEKLCTEVRNLEAEDAELFAKGITISLGVAVFPLHGKSDDEIFNAADKALYISKQKGRNRVTIAD